MRARVARGILVLSLAPAAVHAQTVVGTSERHPDRAMGAVANVPRTPSGHPDVQGVWTISTLTPLQRPKEAGGKPYFTVAEAADWVAHAHDRAIANQGKINIDTTGESPEIWSDARALLPGRRTSLIVDPEDGRAPMRADTQARVQRDAAELRRRQLEPDDPEDLDPAARCLKFPGVGPPMLVLPYNSNIQIVDAGSAIVISSEMIHDARVVAIDGPPHLPAGIRQWLGDSRGHWEGDTLVVDTTNFRPGTGIFGTGDTLHVVERFTRRDAETLLYRFTVDDPSAFTQPWSAEMPLTRADTLIYEYACHEANYSTITTLRGARVQDERR